MNKFKKFLNVLIILTAVIFIAVCVDLLTNKTLNTSYDSLSTVDQGAISEICDIDGLFDKRKGNDEVWDVKYNLNGTPCIIMKKNGFIAGRAYAINLDFSKSLNAQRIEMPGRHSDIPVYRLAFCSPEGLLFRFSSDDIGNAEVKKNSVLAMKYTSNTVKYKGAGSLEETYVKNTFVTATESPDQPEAKVEAHFQMEEENIALMGLQYRIIDDMRTARSLKELNELIAEYVKVRDYQADMYPEFERQAEEIELVDGRKQYVFYKVSELTKHDITYFNKEKNDSITFFSAYHYLCTGRYNSEVSDFVDYLGYVYSGAALCEIMKEQGFCHDWEKRLDNSTNTDFVSPYTLYKEYCEKACGEYDKKTIDDIKREYNYEQMISMARALIKGNE